MLILMVESMRNHRVFFDEFSILKNQVLSRIELKVMEFSKQQEKYTLIEIIVT